MKTRLLVGLLVGGLMTAMLPGVASAAKPDKGDVYIDSRMELLDPGPNTGTFVARGPAVDDGILCGEGRVEDQADSVKFAGWQSASGKLQITVAKEFICDDGSGSFFAKLQIHFSWADLTERFSWVVKGGTGAYEQLRGSGGGTSEPVFESDDWVAEMNYYDGFVING